MERNPAKPLRKHHWASPNVFAGLHPFDDRERLPRVRDASLRAASFILVQDEGRPIPDTRDWLRAGSVYAVRSAALPHVSCLGVQRLSHSPRLERKRRVDVRPPDVSHYPSPPGLAERVDRKST